MTASEVLRWSFGAFCAFAASLACGPTTPSVGGGGTTSGGTAGDAGSSTFAPAEAGSIGDGDGDGDADTGEPPVLFLVQPDGGGTAFECDIFAQDCAPGFKCNVWANDGGNSWNATKCVPIAPDAGEPGEPCTVEGSGVSGIDTCALGALCWDVDPETLEGVCISFCTGTASNPVCEDPNTTCEGRDIPLCLPRCCPLEQDCVAGQGCYAVQDSFTCAPDASGAQGAFGDACEFINVCDPGMVCLGASAVPGCRGSVGCCSPFCVVGSDSCSLLHPAMDCVAWFEEGHAPAGFEHVGVCVLPS
jgi:hypothetical protein